MCNCRTVSVYRSGDSLNVDIKDTIYCVSRSWIASIVIAVDVICVLAVLKLWIVVSSACYVLVIKLVLIGVRSNGLFHIRLSADRISITVIETLYSRVCFVLHTEAVRQKFVIRIVNSKRICIHWVWITRIIRALVGHSVSAVLAVVHCVSVAIILIVIGVSSLLLLLVVSWLSAVRRSLSNGVLLFLTWRIVSILLVVCISLIRILLLLGTEADVLILVQVYAPF